MKTVYFLCEPKANVHCPKTYCYHNNTGLCRHTTNYKFSIHYTAPFSHHLRFVKSQYDDDIVFTEHFFNAQGFYI